MLRIALITCALALAPIGVAEACGPYGNIETITRAEDGTVVARHAMYGSSVELRTKTGWQALKTELLSVNTTSVQDDGHLKVEGWTFTDRVTEVWSRDGELVSRTVHARPTT